MKVNVQSSSTTTDTYKLYERKRNDFINLEVLIPETSVNLRVPLKMTKLTTYFCRAIDKLSNNFFVINLYFVKGFFVPSLRLERKERNKEQFLQEKKNSKCIHQSEDSVMQ